MERPLTSWKEIATHFNKSVRTVQRWEQQFGLPVRRPDAHDHGIVAAFPSELDQWMHTHLVVRPEPANGHGEPLATPAGPRRQTTYTLSFEKFHQNHQRSSELVRETHALLERVRSNYTRLKITLDRNGDLYKRFGDHHGRTMTALAGGGRPHRSDRYSARAS